MNMNIMDRAWYMFYQLSLSQDFWTDAINMAYYLVHKSSSTTIEMMISIEIWSSAPTNYSVLKTIILLMHMSVMVT